MRMTPEKLALIKKDLKSLRDDIKQWVAKGYVEIEKTDGQLMDAYESLVTDYEEMVLNWEPSGFYAE